MRIYQVHSTTFGADVQLTFNQNGILIGYQVIGEELATVPSGTNIRLSVLEIEFLALMKTHNMKVTEVDRKITFDMFWNRYAHKVDKKEALAKWNSLSKDDQIEAFDHIPIYEAMLKRSPYARNKVDPLRYLKKERWNDNK